MAQKCKEKAASFAMPSGKVRQQIHLSATIGIYICTYKFVTHKHCLQKNTDVQEDALKVAVEVPLYKLRSSLDYAKVI